MISRVHVVLGHSVQALRHADRCFDLMQDFDIAYAYEGLAQAYALLGDQRKAQEYLDLAQQAREAIKDREDKLIFDGDIKGGD